MLKNARPNFGLKLIMRKFKKKSNLKKENFNLLVKVAILV